jgi:hypothetical protein
VIGFHGDGDGLPGFGFGIGPGLRRNPGGGVGFFGVCAIDAEAYRCCVGAKFVIPGRSFTHSGT